MQAKIIAAHVQKGLNMLAAIATIMGSTGGEQLRLFTPGVQLGDYKEYHETWNEDDEYVPHPEEKGMGPAYIDRGEQGSEEDEEIDLLRGDLEAQMIANVCAL